MNDPLAQGPPGPAGKSFEGADARLVPSLVMPLETR
jgi:hypothetical protein